MSWTMWYVFFKRDEKLVQVEKASTYAKARAKVEETYKGRVMGSHHLKQHIGVAYAWFLFDAGGREEIWFYSRQGAEKLGIEVE